MIWITTALNIFAQFISHVSLKQKATALPCFMLDSRCCSRLTNLFRKR